MLSNLTALAPPNVSLPRSSTVPKRVASPLSARNEEAAYVHTLYDRKNVDGAAVNKRVTKSMYPEIVEMKLAGRSTSEIAHELGAPTAQMRLHVPRAMSAYRKGEVVIRADRVIAEAQATGQEKTAKFMEMMSGSPTDFAGAGQVSVVV